MKNLTKDKFYTDYLIYKNLTPDKHYKTYLAMRKNPYGNPYSVILKEMDEKRAIIYSELSTTWNPYLSDTYDVFFLTDSEHPESNHYIAVTEYVYADGSPNEESLSLEQFVKKNGPLSESASLSVCIQLCEGLKLFHKKGFVHRDLKPDNIMIAKYDSEHPLIKITDFGGSKQQASEKQIDTTVIGTLGYQPPESVSAHTSAQADIYSIGCILNFMLTGQEPGIQSYKNNHYIVHIIEKATNVDFSWRYKDVNTMQRQLEHELRIRRLDRIPILRILPGFRTHTLWKEVIATYSYLCIIFVLATSLLLGNSQTLASLVRLIIFYFLPLLILFFNMGNCLRFFPKKLRKNNRMFMATRIVILAILFIIPAMIP